MSASILATVRSDQTGQRLLGRRNIWTAELDGVNNERCQLVERDTLRPAFGKRCHLVVCCKGLDPKPAKQPHHREIKFTMAAKRSRIDDPADSPVANQPIARPEIAMETCRWFIGTAQVSAPGGNRFELTDRLFRKGIRLRRKSSEWAKSLGCVELRPGRARFVGKTTRASTPSILPAETGRSAAVERGQRPTKLSFGCGVWIAGLYPLLHQDSWILGHRDDLGHRKGAGLTQPGQPDGFCDEEGRRRIRFGLGKYRLRVRQHDPIGIGHVTAAERHHCDDFAIEYL